MPPTSRTCPCCGQIIAPDVNLVGLKRRLYDAVKRRPMTADALRGLLWSGTRNGGPEDAGALYTLVWQVNQALKPHGVAIRTSAIGKQCNNDPYRLVSL